MRMNADETTEGIDWSVVPDDHSLGDYPLNSEAPEYGDSENDWIDLDEDYDEPVQLGEGSFFRRAKLKALIA
jgi:hypothetical protein